MSTHDVTLRVHIDDEALAEHDGDAAPPPNDLDDWYGGDVERALELGIMEIEHAEIRFEPVSDDEGDG